MLTVDTNFAQHKKHPLWIAREKRGLGEESPWITPGIVAGLTLRKFALGVQ